MCIAHPCHRNMETSEYIKGKMQTVTNSVDKTFSVIPLVYYGYNLR